MKRINRLQAAFINAGFEDFIELLQKHTQAAEPYSIRKTYLNEFIGRSNKAFNKVTKNFPPKKKTQKKTTTKDLSHVALNFIRVINHMDFAKKPFINNGDQKSLSLIRTLRAELSIILAKQNIEIFPQIGDVFNKDRHITGEIITPPNPIYNDYPPTQQTTIIEVWHTGYAIKGKDKETAYVSILKPALPKATYTIQDPQH